MSSDSYLLLRLEGPMQSWGLRSNHDIRETQSYPTYSGLLGLLGATLGIDRDDKEKSAELRGLSLTIYIVCAGQVMSDYHTVGAHYEDRQWMVPKANGAAPDTVVTKRQYLCDSKFVAVFQGKSSLVHRCEEALRNPVYHPHLGRRSCMPSAPLLLDVCSNMEGCLEAIRDYAEQQGVPVSAEDTVIEVIRDASDAADTEAVIRDVPLNGKSRSFGSRRITRDIISL